MTCFALVSTGDVLLAIVMFLASYFGFAIANVFYDGMLPVITTDDTIDRVSSKGYAYGYVGSGVYLLIAMIFIFYSEDLGLAESLAARLAIGGSGIWWGGFSWYAFRRLREVDRAGEMPGARCGPPPVPGLRPDRLQPNLEDLSHLSGHRHLLLFVIAYIFYIDGVQTVINISAIYASRPWRSAQPSSPWCCWWCSSRPSPGRWPSDGWPTGSDPSARSWPPWWSGRGC